MRVDRLLGEHHAGQLRGESASAKAERIIGEELYRLRWTRADLEEREENPPEENGTSNRLLSPTFIPPLTNRVQENLIRGGVTDFLRDRGGKLRSVRPLRGIDSKVNLNKGLWGLAERIANGDTLPASGSVVVAAGVPGMHAGGR